MNYINGYCTVRNNQIVKDHRVILERQGSGRNAFFDECYSLFKPQYPRFHKINPLSQLGIIAAEILLEGTNLSNDYDPGQIAVILSNASSSLETDIDYVKSSKEIPSPSLFVYTLPNIVTGEICIRHHFKGENTFMIFSKFDPAFISTHVDGLLNDSASVCVSGWVEVFGDDYEAFLCLIEKRKGEIGIEHTAENLLKLYISE